MKRRLIKNRVRIPYHFLCGHMEDRIYNEVGDDMAYFEDTGNFDARTEGMSYGMMMCVQK